jgi:protein TonB
MNINQEANMDTMVHMEPRHFALPAAFVLTLLAFLLFGMNNPKRASVTGEPPRAPRTNVDDPKQKPDDPPPLIALSDPEAGDTPVEGGGGQPQPGQIDEPQIYRPGVFVVPVEPPTPQPTRPVSTIGPVGRSEGKGEGQGFGHGPVASWKDLDQPPRTKAQASPVYPTQEKSGGITGTVEVEFTVDESGAVVNPWVVRSTHSAFEEPTLRAVEKWRFVPGRRLGQVVRFRMRVPVLFNLSE